MQTAQLYPATFLALALALTPLAAAGNGTLWIANDGVFDDAANWETGFVPTLFDDARFSAMDGVTRAICFDRSEETNVVDLESGDFAFVMNGEQWRVGLIQHYGPANATFFDGELLPFSVTVHGGTMTIDEDSTCDVLDTVSLFGTFNSRLQVDGALTTERLEMAFVPSFAPPPPPGTPSSLVATGQVAVVGTDAVNIENGSIVVEGQFDLAAPLVLELGNLLVPGGLAQVGDVDMQSSFLHAFAGGSVDARDIEVGQFGNIWSDERDTLIRARNLDTDGDVRVFDGGTIEVEEATTLGFNALLEIEPAGTFRTGSLCGPPGSLDWMAFGRLELTDQTLTLSDSPLDDLVQLTESRVLSVPAIDTFFGQLHVLDSSALEVAGDVLLRGDDKLLFNSELKVRNATADIGGDLQLGTGSQIGELLLETGGTINVGGEFRVTPSNGADISGVLNAAEMDLNVAVLRLLSEAGAAIRVGDLAADSSLLGFVIGATNPVEVRATLSTIQINDHDLIIGNLGQGALVLDFTDMFVRDIWVGLDGVGRLDMLFGDVAAETVFVSDGSALTLDENSAISCDTMNCDGRLESSGVIYGEVVNTGGMVPAGSSNTGELLIDGDAASLVLGTDSILEIELGDSSVSDLITVDGAILLEGTLELSMLDGEAPLPGEAWEIVRSIAVGQGGGITGTFASVEPADQFQVIYTPNSVVIEALEIPCTADIDGSGHVGFDDLADLLTHWGACPIGPCPWDQDGSGHVGFDDLADVLLHWGLCG